MFCWLILTVIQYLSHYFYSRIVLRQKDTRLLRLKNGKRIIICIWFLQPKANPCLILHLQKKSRAKHLGFFFYFLLRLDPLLTLSNGQAAVSMPLVYSFYCEESIVSLSSKFQFSGLRMSLVDLLLDQVPSRVWLDWPCSYLFVQQQKFYPLEWKQLRSQGLQPQAGALLYN